MRAVLDTGIYVSFLINPKGAPSQAVGLWLDKAFELVTSEWQLGELRRVSRYKHIQPIITTHEAGTVINKLKRRATVIENLPDVDLSPDPDDNPIIATAIAGQVQYIVSGDKRDMLELRKVEGISIVTAREFVDLFVKSG